jgi:PAS domain S-box-containing protein
VRARWNHIAIAAAALVAATGLRALLDRYLGPDLAYVTYFVAIVFIAWRTSTPVALASAVAGWLGAVYFFVPPRQSLLIHFMAPADWIGSLAYFAVASSIVFIADRMRRAQQHSTESGRQLQLISNRLPALVSYIGRDRRYAWCNDAYTRWFGLTREQVVGRTMDDVLGAAAMRAIGPHVDAALAGRFVEYETEARYAHGGTRWVHVTYTPHHAADGSVQGIVAMVTDISERKRAERNASILAGLSEALALQPSTSDAAQLVTERLVEELALSRCVLVEIDEEADAGHLIHQHSRLPAQEEVAAFRVSDYLTEDERRQLAEGRPLVIRDVRAGRSSEAAERFAEHGIGAVVSAPYVSEGRRKFALAAERDAPYDWPDDEVVLLREVAARICGQLDRARAEQTLRESERRYRLLAAVITDIPCNVDAVGRFVAPQEAWLRYTGQSFAQSRDFGWFDAVHPEDREPARQAWIESLRSRRPYEVRVRLWHAASRQFRHVIARAVPLLDEAGELREWVGACTDIHEETEQARALIEADRRKDEFLATLAHELRNPLAPIRNGVYILKLTGKAEGSLASVYQMLERQVRHLVRLVDDLLEVSRITRGRVELRKELTDAQAVIESAIETSRPVIEDAGHLLEVTVPPEPLRLEADPVRLAQVLTNLLNNAAKYTDKGGIIALTARREGEHAVISVRDNGRGIAAEMLPRIFDLFTQALPRHVHAQGGLGIGLTLVRSLVELHGGTVQARSEGHRRGSEFVVRLPLEATDRGAAAASPAAGALGSARRVLVVDDNRDAADSLGVVLALHGIESRTAHDGRSALEALEDFRPSVILLDLAMPGMDGYEVAQRVRQHPRGRHVVIVALTGWGQERDRLRSQGVGIDHHLVKPVDIEALRQLLASLPAVTEAA